MSNKHCYYYIFLYVYVIFLYYANYTFQNYTLLNKFQLLKKNLDKESNLFFIRELYYKSEERFTEIKKSVFLTFNDNPSSRFVFLTSITNNSVLKIIKNIFTPFNISNAD